MSGRIACIALALIVATGAAVAQGTEVAFGVLTHDASLPVEVTADQLSIDQSDGSAEFSGGVVAGQGDMRLSSNRMRVEYSAGDAGGTGRISRLIASGNVVLVSGAEAAEAQEAVYTIDSGNIVLTGGVILTQGENALSANRMVIDLGTGTARMDGRVRTILQPGAN